MGGRVAISYAAMERERVSNGGVSRLAAVVVVDQDCICRTAGVGALPLDSDLTEAQRQQLESRSTLEGRGSWHSY